MMDILGYDRLPIRDPDTRQPVAIATVNGQYRMLFQFRENASIRVDAHIVIGHGAIGERDGRVALYRRDRVARLFDPTAETPDLSPLETRICPLSMIEM